jgi:Flagellin and related hook-associated proteins
MSFQINTNIGALGAYNALARTNAEAYQAQLRLATRKKINSVADDTSGFATGKSLDQKVKLMQAAQNNVGSAKDMLSTAETQLISVKDLITQIKVKIADSSNPAADKSRIASDIKALGEEIGNIFNNTKFNDTTLLVSSSSGAGKTFDFQTGAATSDKMQIDYASANLAGTMSATIGSATVDGINQKVADSLNDIQGLVSSSANADSIGSLSAKLLTFESTIDTSLSSVGNYKQRLDIKDDFLTSAIANSTASVSRLFDADMAMEQLKATKAQIGAQIATSMLSQLNSEPQNILSLFK